MKSKSSSYVNPLSLSFSLFYKHSRFDSVPLLFQTALPKLNVRPYLDSYDWKSTLRTPPNDNEFFLSHPPGVLFDVWILSFWNDYPEQDSNKIY